MRFIAWLVLGIVIGPSVLHVPVPVWYPTVAQAAGGLFLFLAGWELRFLNLAKERKFYALLFVGSFVVPFLAGFWLLGFNTFLAVAISISALPVAIQILKEKNLYDSDLSRKVVTLSSLCDICAWLVMGFLFPAENLKSWIVSHWAVFAFFVGLIFGQFVGWRPILAKMQAWILAPIFFVGLTWKIDFFHFFSWNIFLKIFAVAVASKWLGVYVMARLARVTNSFAKDLAALLNARGAMEILAAHFAYAAGLIDESIFAALVALGIVTSVIAVPLIKGKKS